MSTEHKEEKGESRHIYKRRIKKSGENMKTPVQR
jgi:hypothetical protein